MSAGRENKQSGKTWPEKFSNLVRLAGNHDGIANGKEKDLEKKPFEIIKEEDSNEGESLHNDQ